MEEERNEEEQLLMYQIVDAVSVVMTVFKARAFGALEQSLLPLVMQMAQAGSDPYHAKMAVFVLCDVVEQCVHAHAGGAHHAARYLPAINAALVAGAQSPDPAVRQPAFFGLGLVAQHAGGGIADSAVAQHAQLLQQYVSTAAVWQGEQVNAAENAVAAIGRVCEFRATTAGACCGAMRALTTTSIAMSMAPRLTPRALTPFPRSSSAFPPGVDACALYGVWLSHLPLRNDMPESKSTIEQLCRLVSAGTPALLTGGAQRMGEIARVLVEAVCIEDEGLASLHRTVGGLLQQIGAQLDAATRGAIAASAGADERSVLASVWA